MANIGAEELEVSEVDYGFELGFKRYSGGGGDGGRGGVFKFVVASVAANATATKTAKGSIDGVEPEPW